MKIRRAVSPVIATVLIIALTVAAGATIWVVMNNFFNNSNAELVVDSYSVYDKNNNGLADSLELILRNLGTDDTSIDSVIVTRDGTTVGGWVFNATDIPGSGMASFSIATQLYESELYSGNDVVITIRNTGDNINKQKIKIPGSFALSAVGEASTLWVDGTVQTITFSRTYLNPVVIATAVANSTAAYRSGTLAAQLPIVYDVTSTSFKIYQSGGIYDTNGTSASMVNYLVMETGTYKIGDMEVQVGKVAATGSSSFYSFPVAFNSTPTVIASTQTNNANAQIHSRGDIPTSLGVSLWVVKENLNHPGATSETIGYIAIAGNSTAKEIYGGMTPDSYTHIWKAVNYPQAYIDSPLVFAHMTSADGGDACAVTVGDVTNNNFKISIEETAYYDGAHTSARLSWFSFPEGSIDI